MKKNKINNNLPDQGMKPRGSYSLVYVLMAAWAVLVSYYYLKAYPIDLRYLSVFFSASPGDGFSPADLFFPFRYIKEITLAVIVFFSAWGWGGLINRLVKFDREGTLETGIVRAGVGFVPLVYGTLLPGALRLLYPGVAAALLAAGALAGGTELYLNRSRFSDARSLSGWPKMRLLEKALILVVLAGVFFAFIGALSPETFYDSLMYHLALPLYWIQHHAVSFIPDFEFSYYPINVHLVYLVTLMFGNEVSAKIIPFIFGIMTALLIYSWGKRRFSAHAGILAACVFLLTPLVMMVMMKTAIELGLAFFETLAVLCFLNFIDRRDEGGTRWLVLSALFCGMAMGSKYLSGYCFVALFVVLAAYCIVSRASFGESARKLAIFAAIALALPSPYLIRNYIHTGQPAYPYGFSVHSDFTATTKGEAVECNDPPMPQRTIGNFVTLPWSVTMGKMTQEPYAGGLLLLLLPLPFLFRGADRRILFLAGYVLLYYAMWFLVRPYFRYGIPFVPSAALLLAYFAAEPRVHRYARDFLMAAVILIGVSNLVLTVSIELTSMSPWGVVKGAQTKSEYLSAMRPSYPNPYYGMAEWVNSNLPKDSTILLLGEYRGFYFERRFETQTVVDHTSLVLMLKEARNADDLYDALKKKGITHILLSIPEGRRLASYDTLDFEPGHMKILTRFWNKYITEAHRDIGDLSLPQQGIYSMRKQQPEWWQGYSSDPNNYIYLYEILSREDAQKPHAAPPNRFLTPELYPPARWEKLKDR